jgi:hypothetical protein
MWIDVQAFRVHLSGHFFCYVPSSVTSHLSPRASKATLVYWVCCRFAQLMARKLGETRSFDSFPRLEINVHWFRKVGCNSDGKLHATGHHRRIERTPSRWCQRSRHAHLRRNRLCSPPAIRMARRSTRIQMQNNGIRPRGLYGWRLLSAHHEGGTRRAR